MQQPTAKILYVITQGEWGGAQRYVFDLATSLSSNLDITIAVGEPRGRYDLQKKLSKKYETNTIKILSIKHLVRNISPVHDILAIFELAKLYKTIKPDIVHLNSSKASILGSFARLMAYGVRPMIVYTVHGWVFNEPLGLIKKILYRWLEKLTARWKNKIIVLSPQDFLDGKRLGISENKLVEIPLGIETPKFLEKEAARRFLDPRLHRDDILVGTIANLYPTKGIDILIEATKILNIQYPISNIQFIVIGEGPERKNLESLIKKYHLENTVFLIGALENAARYLPAFDLFVLPSRKEGLPYTLLEAMTAETPIIAANTGGVPSLIRHKETGLLVEPENVKQLSDAIAFAIISPDEMKKHAERALEKIKQLTMETMIESTKTIYFSRPSVKS